MQDPSENVNRRIMAANQEVLRPAAEFVQTAIPGPVHKRLRDFNGNLKEPRILVNNILQGRAEAAVHTAIRFGMNSVFGLGGLFDVATGAGLQQQSGDFGQTMFVWGVPAGPYVVRPYLGPATLRDGVGSVVDMFGNPISFVPGMQLAAVTIGTTAVDAADRLGQLKMAEDASIDFYTFVRSSYYQIRRAELRESIGLGAAVDSPALDDPEAPTAPTATPAAAPRQGKKSAAARGPAGRVALAQ
ncbi:MAG TPA: VacJ family lipoprotein [Bradyrhizobium sp.]|nr:VacJ family lipoprotein [Bradyrhizobium sp.]